MLPSIKNWAYGIEHGNYTDEEKLYVKRSWPRYGFVLQRVEECISDRSLPTDGLGISILDIGPHFFTTLLKMRFPAATINTLGYENYHICPVAMRQEHLTFDLNDTQFPDRWPAFHKYDIIVMGEVIEHLHTAPWLVLSYIKTLMKNGGALVLSTPNAVAADKRIFLLLGRNPFEMLREEYDNPGHIREYTVKELIDIGGKAGFTTDRYFLANYFIFDNFMGRLLFRLTGFIPALRNGITIVYRCQ